MTRHILTASVYIKVRKGSLVVANFTFRQQNHRLSSADISLLRTELRPAEAVEDSPRRGHALQSLHPGFETTTYPFAPCKEQVL